MKVEEMNRNQKWLAKQAGLINATAQQVYSAVQGGIDLNFFKCYEEFQNGVFGWAKENLSFEVAMDIYESYTANDSWDVYGQIIDEFEDITSLEASELAEWNLIETD